MDFSHEADASRAGTARQRGYKTPFLLDVWRRGSTRRESAGQFTRYLRVPPRKITAIRQAILAETSSAVFIW
jgi:hypothetical protein